VKRVRPHVIVIVAFFFIRGSKGEDMLSGCFGGYTQGVVGHISRVCDCAQAGCSDSRREWGFLLKEKMEDTYT
jgi:hypothetical protein